VSDHWNRDIIVEPQEPAGSDIGCRRAATVTLYATAGLRLQQPVLKRGPDRLVSINFPDTGVVDDARLLETVGHLEDSVLRKEKPRPNDRGPRGQAGTALDGVGAQQEHPYHDRRLA
jgi:hypothetical protein